MVWGRFAAAVAAGGALLVCDAAQGQQTGAGPATPAPSTQAPAVPLAKPDEQGPPAEAPQPSQSSAPVTNQLPDVEVIEKKQAETPIKPEPESKKPQVVKKATAPAPEIKTQPIAKKQAPAAESVAAQPVVGPGQVSVPADTAGPPSGDTAVRMAPGSGSEIPLAKVPGGVGLVTAADVNRDGSSQVQNALQSQVPGVILSDVGGNGFRTEVSYRGFDSSPVGGRAQGLAVYQNGVRINEAFGDTVNFDLIPANAINDILVVSNNPVFGLNAIGGAISLGMKDGFNYQGAEIDIMGGSFERRQIALKYGAKSGGFGAYIAAEGIEDGGFRDFSDSNIKRMYADLGVKGDAAELHFSLTAAKSTAGVVAASPVELLDRDWSRTFTSPQDTGLEMVMPVISGRLQATETLTLSGNSYYRSFKSNVIDGNLTEVDECALPANAGFLCLTEDGIEERVKDQNGKDVTAAAVDDPLGSIERINTDAESYGGSLQAVEKARLFGLGNQFLLGASYDHGTVRYQTSSELGTIGPRFVVSGSGITVVEPDDLAPRDLETENDYYGIYFSNTLDVTDAFALTVGGRYNHATIKLSDLTGEFPDLNTTNKYERFNPMVGGTYRLMPGLTFYGGYSEANRAPTAAELGCAEPANPCFIESFLTDDPPLKQVVSHSFEAGLRGEYKNADREKFTWSLGYFRTLNTDDILNVAATTTGRGFFLNAGDTLRQGVELGAGYQNSRFSTYGSYAFVDATFEDNLILPAPNTPGGTSPCPGTAPADDVACNFVSAGDHLPGIPQHRFKAGFNYFITPKWQFGADFVAATSQRFYGDEANNNEKLSGYTRFDLHTAYDVNDNVQIYGLVKNLFDRRYGLYGTFFDAAEANDVSSGSGVKFNENEARSITPAMPFAAYGGLKIRF